LIKETGRHSASPVFIVGMYSGFEKIGEGYGSSLQMAETRVFMVLYRLSRIPS
jgi:large subunit ribosomal protein L44